MASSLKEKKDSDLLKLLAQKREALREIRFGVAGSKSRNVREARSIRKDIARVLTEMGSRRDQHHS